MVQLASGKVNFLVNSQIACNFNTKIDHQLFLVCFR